MENTDYYALLGVEKSAGDDEIKKAFRQKAKQYHPDLNKGDKAAAAEEQFKKVNEAYSVLSDQEKRRQYDAMGHEAFNQAASGGGGGYGQDFGGFGGGGGFGDIFETLFGNMGFGGASGARSTGPQRGRSLRFEMNITLEEAFSGVTKQINVGRNEACKTCGGSGAKKGSQPETCGRCQGSGQVQSVQQSPFGRFVNVTACPDCGGTGKIIKEPCDSCKGKGTVYKQRNINIKIPAGIDTGQSVSLSGEGEAGLRGGPPGDVQVIVYVRPHRVFERRGNDLYMELSVPFAQAALGGEIIVPTMESPVKYTMPECTKAGTVFRLKGRGMPRLQANTKGDLYVNVGFEMPKKLSEKQKELLREFVRLDNPEGEAQKGKIFERKKKRNQK